MSEATPGRGATAARALRGMGAALCVIVAAALALTTYDPFPGWGTDPAVLPTPIMGFGPAGLAQGGVLMLLGAAAYLLGCSLGGVRVAAWQVVLFVVGAAAAFVHVALRETITVENVSLGAAWIGALAAGLTVAHAAGDPRQRRVIAAAVAGVVAAMVVKAVVQVFVEHPRTVAEYRATREAFLASQGWEPGSAMAAAFERRLFQPEATAWFGLANVYSTFAAWGVVLMIGVAACAWVDRRRAPVGRGSAWIGALLIAAAVGLVMGGAKGGYAAAVAGGGLAALAAWRRARGSSAAWVALARAVGVGAIAGPIAAVALRGAVGERLGELSLLFRWFYLQGAARIIVEHPLGGVGPAGFKDAYLLAKPVLSPEEVTSPHSVLFDWVACLGVGGVAWGALLGAWAISAARATFNGSGGAEGEGEGSAESRLRVGLLAGWALVVLLAVSQESGGVGPEGLLARVVGVAAGIGIGMATLRVLRTRGHWAWVLGPASLAAVAHTQVEMTAAHPTAAGLLMVAVGLGAGSAASGKKGDGRLALLAGALLAGGVVAMQVAALDVRRWQGNVESASRLIGEPTELLRRLSVAGGAGAEPVSAVVQDARALDASAPSDPRRLAARLEAEVARRLPEARGELLDHLVDHSIDHFETLRAASRLALLESRVAAARDEPVQATQALGEANRAAETGTANFPASSQAWGWLATVRGLAGVGGAIEALERAAELDPHGLAIRVRLADACAEAGEGVAARGWALRALEADRNLRLDPLRRLSDVERARMERLAGPEGPPGP